MLNKMNRYFRNRDNLKNVQVLSAIAFIWVMLFSNMSRAGVFGTSYIVAVVIIIIGIILIVIPEPLTTLTGIGLVIGGLVMIFGTAYLQSLADQYGIWFWVVIIGSVILYLKYMRR